MVVKRPYNNGQIIMNNSPSTLTAGQKKRPLLQVAEGSRLKLSTRITTLLESELEYGLTLGLALGSDLKLGLTLSNP